MASLKMLWLLTVLLLLVSQSSVSSESLQVASNSSTTVSIPLTQGTTKVSSPTLVSEFKRVCRGTSTGLGHSTGHLETYRAMYTNCTYIDGNLEIVFVENKDADLSFLQNIREVTGYVLLVANYLDYIPLTSLRIIRGRTLFEDRGRYFSLYVALNYDLKFPGVGLKELRFTSLHEILAGNVFIFNNRELCYERTINWKDILTGEGAEVIFVGQNDTLPPQPDACMKCNSACATNNCWGSGPEHCQKLTKVSCSPQCDGRCFGTLPNECCHPECAGGCRGPTKADCWACKNFDNDELCENFCPPEYIYSPTLYKQVLNPRAKFSYGSLCVDKCPSHLIADMGACVQDCGTGRMPGKNNKCVDCVGPCPKACVFPDDVVHAYNVRNLTGCTVIQGHIKILESTFNGDRYLNIPPMPVSSLSALSYVREVTDYVLVQANNPNFRNLSFLKSLEVIQGRNLGSGGTSLQVYLTSIEALGLERLREVRNGHIYIANNSRLCYASTINWAKVRSLTAQKVIIQHNRNATICQQDNEVCSSECTSDGCWGPMDDHCFDCQHYHLNRRCLKDCTAIPGLYESGENECQRCHPECKGNCIGGGADQCEECRNARDGPYCVSECPVSKYRDENGICQSCHKNCAEGAGCKGPRNSIGEDACNSCALVVVAADNVNVTHCLPPDAPCDEGYFKHFYTPKSGVQACLRCHPECKTCSGQGLSFCSECVHFRQDDRCVASCSPDYYVKMVPGTGGGVCESCDSRCLRCTGPTASQCLTCKQYKIYLNHSQREIDPRFNCTEKCPDYAPFKETVELSNGETETVCVSEDAFAKKRAMIIFGATGGGFVLVTAIVISVIILCIQKQRAEHARVKLSAKMSGCEESVPLYPTGAEPDMSVLRLIKESDLSRGQIIGTGAFGTVYRGLWLPSPGEKKIPVAIKILHDGCSSTQNKESLEEARIMASVVHPCCVQIKAVCMTAHIMLISELMPLGCLLDYVRTEGATLDSRTLLLWARQIAEGMAHLESKLIVHRDLAARNVLVQNKKQVKITDFGLAKLLDFREDQFLATAGKMPIKWMALESIQHRKFTHKSDVWSYGVTLWELFTFGQRPYESVRAIDLCDLLEKGERLNQPSICTIDVYMLMVKCWTVVAEDRPKFSELVMEFDKMSHDPLRYIVISTERPADQQHQPFTDPAHADYDKLNSYLRPLPSAPMDKVVEEDSDEVFSIWRPQTGSQPGATVKGGRERLDSQRRQRSISGAPYPTGASGAVRRSTRYCSDPCTLHGGNCTGIAFPTEGLQPLVSEAERLAREEDGYMLPTQTTSHVGNPSIKYVDLVDGEKAVDHDVDDGFDSESTVTPVGFHNDYYNSQDLMPLNTTNPSSLFKQPNACVHHANPKKPPARGNSESIGSLDTDATGSAGGDDDSDRDHDYYNEFSPAASRPAATRVRSSEQVLLKPAQLEAGSGNCQKSSPVWVAKSRAN